MNREEARLLRKGGVEAFVESLLPGRALFGPVMRGNSLLFDTIGTSRDLVLGRGNSVNSAKSALFPQTERLFAFRLKGTDAEIEELPEEKGDLVLFGVRPCDARAFLLLDGVFAGNIADPYYARKRARRLVISVACTMPAQTCFCLAMGGGPCSTEGSDLLLFDLGDRYLAKPASAQGMALLENDVFESADDEAICAANLVKKNAEAITDRSPLAARNGAGPSFEARLEALFDHSVWDELTETCLGCGLCTYLCPTCHCFDICDEAGPSTAERIRVWDSCQFPLFTRQASGFNPRPSVRERFRQRIMHKFCYLPKKGNLTGCVGCGRCVVQCPVNLDVREVIQRLAEVKA